MEARVRSHAETTALDGLASWFQAWRVASSRHAHALYGPTAPRSTRGRWSKGGVGLTLRGVQDRLKVLSADDRIVARALSVEAGQRVFRLFAVPGEPDLLRHWQEADVSTAMRVAGWEVVRGQRAAEVVRRHVIDRASTEEARSAVRRDGRTPVSELKWPVAVRNAEVVIVWVDDGSEIGAQGQRLPIWVGDQGPLKIVVRPRERESVFSAGEKRWTEMGPRLRSMLQLLKDAPGGSAVAFAAGGHQRLLP